MEYLLMIYVDEEVWPTLSKTEQEQGTAAYKAYTDALAAAGALRAGKRLKASSTATTLRSTNGKSQVLDGPFIDSKEQLGRLYLIDAPDLDAALSWAARCPAVNYGVVEVRPLWS